MTNRFHMSELLGGILPRLLPIRNRLLGKTGFREMMGHQLWVCCNRLGKLLLYHLRCLDVQLLPLALEQRFIRRILE